MTWPKHQNPTSKHNGKDVLDADRTACASRSRAKYSLVSLTTTGLSNSKEIRLGIAMRPLSVSASSQAKSSWATAPKGTANTQITRNGQTIFDNRMGVPEDPDVADPQAISGGSIVIHK